MTLTPQELAGQFAKFFPDTAAAPPSPAEAGDNTAPAPVAAAPSSRLGCQVVDFAAKGYHLDVSVEPNQVVQAAQLLDQNGFAIDAVTGVDWMAENQMEVVYDYFHPRMTWRVAVRARIPRGCPEIPTISNIFPGANWHERETHDFFGIRFVGHPNLITLLLPEDADYHPLRKDFTA